EWVWDWVRSPRGRAVGEMEDLEALVTNISLKQDVKDRVWDWVRSPRGRAVGEMEDLEALVT
ncbi:hypothetical protein Tco_0397506, partial [Tanacetum coccineum]